ncbi:PilN domain-containing protein [Curvibacter delicatus]|uniref:PilN domain-containing protein n=1 Tax=Curvibacter delicatus TaxID=80879 RepID=UPI00082AB8BC|nr:PilN domain-containing protein [Curvibacter delicatus]
MILINLLPHREAARKKRQDVFNLSLVASALAGAVIACVIYLWLQGQISSQQDQNMILQKEIASLDAQIKEIAGLEAEIAALRARQQVVEDLQSDRNLPVHMLSELVKQLPDGVYITNMRQENQAVSLQGVAQSNERVSELLRNLANNTPWFSKPELVEIVAGNITLGARDQRRVSNFSIRVRLVRASEAQKAQPATGSVPTAAASAPAGK